MKKNTCILICLCLSMFAAAQATLPTFKTVKWEHPQITLSVPADFVTTLSNNDMFKAKNAHIYLEISLTVPVSQNPDLLKIINSQATELKKFGTVEAPQKIEEEGTTGYLLMGNNYARKFYQILAYDKTENLIMKIFLTYVPAHEETAQQILSEIATDEEEQADEAQLKTINWKNWGISFKVPADFETEQSDNNNYKAQNEHIYVEMLMAVVGENPNILASINAVAAEYKKYGTASEPQKYQDEDFTGYSITGKYENRSYYYVLFYSKELNFVLSMTSIFEEAYAAEAIKILESLSEQK